MTKKLTSQDIVDYLQTNPDFFAEHTEVLNSIRLPNAYGNRALSLYEYQMTLMRDKNKTLEKRLADIIHYGRHYDSLAEKYDQLTAKLLSENNSQRLPQLLCENLSTIFDIPFVAIKTWPIDLTRDKNTVDLEEIQQYANDLTKPYCGPNSGCKASKWLIHLGQAQGNNAFNEVSTIMDGNTQVVANMDTTQDTRFESIAFIPLRSMDKNMASTSTFGLLGMGSDDINRFEKNMSVDLLARIGKLTSATLMRNTQV